MSQAESSRHSRSSSVPERYEPGCWYVNIRYGNEKPFVICPKLRSWRFIDSEIWTPLPNSPIPNANIRKLTPADMFYYRIHEKLLNTYA